MCLRSLDLLAERSDTRGIDGPGRGDAVSRRLLQLVIPVTPERRMFRIHDPAVDPDTPGGPLPPVGALISTAREQLWVGSLQEDIDVRLVLEEWDEAPPPCGDAWDEEAKGTIYLRGQLSISMGLAGTAVRGLRLAGGVGDYAVRVYASNREQVTRRYAELFDRHRNPLSDEFQQEKKTLEGLERYLVQLWRESLAAVPLPRRACRGAGYGLPPGEAAWPAACPLGGVVPRPALAPAVGAADVPDAAVLALAADDAADVVLTLVPPEEMATSVRVLALGVTGVRGPCARNGIIA